MVAVSWQIRRLCWLASSSKDLTDALPVLAFVLALLYIPVHPIDLYDIAPRSEATPKILETSKLDLHPQDAWPFCGSNLHHPRAAYRLGNMYCKIVASCQGGMEEAASAFRPVQGMLFVDDHDHSALDRVFTR